MDVTEADYKTVSSQMSAGSVLAVDATTGEFTWKNEGALGYPPFFVLLICREARGQSACVPLQMPTGHIGCANLQTILEVGKHFSGRDVLNLLATVATSVRKMPIFV